MTDPGKANNRISDTTVHGSAFQARDVGSVVINNYSAPTAPADGSRETAHSWATEVADSPLWRSVPEGRNVTRFQVAARDIAASLTVLHDEGERVLTDDPWWDRLFATRFHGEIGQLACSEDGPDWDFQPAEALLLILAPYLSQTLWVRTAAARVHVGPTNLRLTRADGDRAGYEKFFDRGYERLVRRATLGLAERPGAESDIGFRTLSGGAQTARFRSAPGPRERVAHVPLDRVGRGTGAGRRTGHVSAGRGAAAAGRHEPWFHPEYPVPLSRLWAASVKFGVPLPDIAERFRRLGCDVPDLRDTIRAAMSKLSGPRA